jgi:hypothetical protein
MKCIMLVISDAQTFRFDVGHLAYRVGCGKVHDDDLRISPIGEEKSGSISTRSAYSSQPVELHAAAKSFIVKHDAEPEHEPDC